MVRLRSLLCFSDLWNGKQLNCSLCTSVNKMLIQSLNWTSDHKVHTKTETRRKIDVMLKVTTGMQTSEVFQITDVTVALRSEIIHHMTATSLVWIHPETFVACHPSSLSPTLPVCLFMLTVKQSKYVHDIMFSASLAFTHQSSCCSWAIALNNTQNISTLTFWM